MEHVPNDRELDAVIERVHRSHSVGVAPPDVHDWWAGPDLVALVAEVSPMLDPLDRRLVAAAARQFAEVDRRSLPHALVHGDLAKPNVNRRRNGGLAVIDLPVATWRPRVYELAVIVVNLMHGHPTSYPERIADIAARYGRHSALTSLELRAFPRYVSARAAMELLEATREWAHKGNRSAETSYQLELGRSAVWAAAR